MGAGWVEERCAGAIQREGRREEEREVRRSRSGTWRKAGGAGGESGSNGRGRGEVAGWGA